MLSTPTASTSFFPYRLRAYTCLSAVVLCALPHAAVALPEGGVVSSGVASITQSGKKLDVVQGTDKAVIDWRGFDIAPDEHTQFHQPSSNAVTMNRINSGAPSTINGKLTANGNVVLMNQNGILFGKSAQVDVNGLIATTAMSDDKTLMRDGVLALDAPGNPNAAIINEGQITAKEAGLVGFVAPNVINNGIITAKMGQVQLASGDSAAVDLYGDGLMQVAVSDKVQSQLVANGGIVHADGGNIALTAAAGKEIVNSLIVSEGVLQAQTVAQKNGEIIISAAGSNAVAGNISADKGKKQGASTVLVAGVVDVSGRVTGERGGNITIIGDNVALLNGTFLDASGHTGKVDTTVSKKISDKREGAAGGDIKVGGDYLGQGSTPTAKNLVVEEGVVVANESLHRGDAGRSIFWSDDTTDFKGAVFGRALGGQPINPDTGDATRSAKTSNLNPQTSTGNGGFVETSGHKQLNAGGYVNLTASAGEKGTYFLDPTNITIYGNVDPKFVSTDGTSVNLAPNLKLWLDGDDIDGDGVSEDSAETGLVSGVGNCGSAITCVSQWTDKSGNGNHATNGTAGARPAFSSNIQNGRDVLYFDGSDGLKLADASNGVLNDIGTGSFNIMIAAQFTPLPTAWQQMLSNWNANTGLHILAMDDGSFGGYIYENTEIYTPHVLNTNYTLYQANSLGSGLANKWYTNGNLVHQTTRTGTLNSLSETWIGRRGDAASQFLTGNVPEMLIYNTMLSDANRNLVEQYQSAKWGIGLDPLTGAATEVAEATASIQKGDAADGYSVFSTRYLERLSQSANISLQSSNNINLDLKGDTLNFTTAGRSLSLTAGNQITTASAGNITTNNGAVTLNATGGINLNHAIGLTTNGGNITLGNATTLGAAQTWNAGTGTMNINSTLASGANDLTLISDDIALGGNVSGTGNLTLRTTTPTQQMNYGTGASGYLMSSTEVNRLMDGWNSITLGNSAATANLNVGNTTWKDPVTFTNNGLKTLFSNLTGTGNASFTFAGSGGLDTNGNITTAGGSVTATGVTYVNNKAANATITTNGGTVSVSSLLQRGADGNLTINTSGGNISVANRIYNNGSGGSAAGKSVTLNAGTGDVSITNDVDSEHNYTITGANVSIGGNSGTTRALGTTTFTAVNNMTLPSITATSILARATGAVADITIAAGKTLTATGVGNALTLAAGRNFINNAGVGALVASAGRWMVFSTDPAQDTVGGLVSDAVEYGKTYADIGTVGAGKRLIYSAAAPIVTPPPATGGGGGAGSSTTTPPATVVTSPPPTVVAIPPVIPVAVVPPPAEPSPTPSVTTPTPDTAFAIPNTVFIISQTGVPLQEVARTPFVQTSRNVQTQETFETSDASSASSQSDAEGSAESSLSASDDAKPLYRTIMHGLLRIHPALKARLGLSDDFIKSL